MKNNVLKIILTVLFVSLVLFGIGLYLYEVFVKHLSPTENLFKLIILAVSGVGGLIKLYGGGKKRRSLDFYEKSYQAELKGAFAQDSASRRSLLQALRLYNENKFSAAAKALEKLRVKCSTHADLYSVELFIALSYTDMGAESFAITVYEGMLSRGLTSATVYGNLGSLYSSCGMKDKAKEVLNLAVNVNPGADVAYNNLAHLEFKLGEFDSAKMHAVRALEINFKNRQAASLLAMIYAVEMNEEEEKKYTKMAIAAGQDALKLESAKRYYISLASYEKKDEDEETSVG